MADTPDNPILVYLRRIDEKVDRLTEFVQDLKLRVTSLEARFASLQSDIAGLHGDFAGQSARMDRIELRLERMNAASTSPTPKPPHLPAPRLGPTSGGRISPQIDPNRRPIPLRTLPELFPLRNGTK